MPTMLGMALPGLGVLGGLGAMAGITSMPGLPTATQLTMSGTPMAPPSQFVLMKNMFDPEGKEEQEDEEFFIDLREDVMEETGKNGAVLDCKIHPKSAGHVLLKFA